MFESYNSPSGTKSSSPLESRICERERSDPTWVLPLGRQIEPQKGELP